MKFNIRKSIILIFLNVLFRLECDRVDQNLRTLESFQEDSVLIFPLIRKNGKDLINISIGTQRQNVDLIIDTAASNSLIYSNRVDTITNLNKCVYNKTLSDSFSSLGSINGKLEKFYDESVFNGVISSDKIYIQSNIDDKTKINNVVEISDYEFLLNEEDTKIRDYDGIFSLSRTANIKFNESGEKKISLLKKISLEHKIKESFMILNSKSDEKTKFSYLAFGNFSKIKDNPSLDNLNTFNISDVSSCELATDKIPDNFKHLWGCSLSELSLDIDTPDNSENSLDKIKSKMNNTYIIIDTSLDTQILIPDNTKLNFTDHNDQSLYLIEYLLNKLGSNCKIKENKPNEEKYKQQILYKTIQCTEKPKDIQGMSLNINGHAHNLTDLFVEVEELIENDANKNGIKQKIYNFQISFYQIINPNPDEKNEGSSENYYWILGIKFIYHLAAIGFDEEDKKIFFFHKNVHDIINDEESLLSFFVLSLLCVILLIIIAFLVPYILYRRSRRAMMEKLQYEIIYKKMNDITREYAK
jgi:hypothetical protein